MAALGAAAIVAGGAIAASSISSSATDKASQEQANASSSAQATQLYMYDQTRSDFAPFLQAGTDAIPSIQNYANQDLTGYDSDMKASLNQMQGNYNTMSGIANDFTDSSIYKYEQADLQDSINKQLSAQGLAGSGRGVQMMGDQVSRLAASEANNKFNRLTTLANVGSQVGQYAQSVDSTNIALNQAQYSRNVDLAKMGQGAAGSMGNAAISTGQGIASNQLQTGVNQANLTLQNANNQAGNIGGAAGYLSNYLTQNGGSSSNNTNYSSLLGSDPSTAGYTQQGGTSWGTSTPTEDQNYANTVLQ